MTQSLQASLFSEVFRLAALVVHRISIRSLLWLPPLLLLLLLPLLMPPRLHLLLSSNARRMSQATIQVTWCDQAAFFPEVSRLAALAMH